MSDDVEPRPEPVMVPRANLQMLRLMAIMNEQELERDLKAAAPKG